MPPRPPSPGLFAESPSPARKSASRSTAPWLNAHCDGGARGNPGPAGFGAVLVDDSGETVAELSEFLGNRTNNFAEYSGLLGCLAYALHHGPPRLRVVSDSELMVKQIQGKYQVKSPDLRPLYDEARRRIAQLEGFEISHALRHKNKDADRLANEAMDRGTGKPAPPAPVIARPAPAATPAATPAASPARNPVPVARPAPVAGPEEMLRGFTRGGVVHILGSVTLPDGLFVKIIRE